MIHYTLLPQKEANDLKLEYKIRVVIVLLFFASIAVIIGIISLFPAYVISSMREKEMIVKLEGLKKGRTERGVDIVLKELGDSNKLLSEFKLQEKTQNYYSIIKRVNEIRIPSVIFTSIQISSIEDAVSDSEVILQGRSLTRESLLELRKGLERSPAFAKVEFPIPDLTKNKDISFVAKLRIKKI